MQYTLIGSIRSPFVRICRMFMIQQKIEFNFQVLDFVENQNDAAILNGKTPINKVPVLIDGHQTIFDSRVIMDYLSGKQKLPMRTIEQENLISVIYSCLDASVILFLMKRDGFDVEGKGFFLERQRARIPQNLEYTKDWAKSLNPSNPQDWNFASMALFSYLYWAQARNILDLKAHPIHEEFLNKFSEVEGVKQTGF